MTTTITGASGTPLPGNVHHRSNLKTELRALLKKPVTDYTTSDAEVVITAAGHGAVSTCRLSIVLARLFQRAEELGSDRSPAEDASLADWLNWSDDNLEITDRETLASIGS